jgi:hypothetical protein
MAGDKYSRRSTAWYVFTIGGTIVSWISKLKKIVALSGDYWLWSLIIFLIHRSLFSVVFIPHEDFTPQKNVHSSTRGSARGVTPLRGPGFGGKAPEGKIAL